MKIRNIFALLSPLISSYAVEIHENEPHFVWIEGRNVFVKDEEAYLETHKGLMRLNAIEYDAIRDQYLVRCNCSKNKGLDPVEALGLFFEEE